MALVTDKFVFGHLPKTGGKYVRNVIAQLGIPHREVGGFHNPISTDLPFVFTIRHPVRWYQSRWYHCIRRGWSTDPLDWHCASNDFNTFVRNVLDYSPIGRMTALVHSFSKNSDTYILKNEKLSNELFMFLNEVGYSIKPEQFLSIPKKNQSGPKGRRARDVAQYQPNTLVRLIESEMPVIDTYYGGVTEPE